MLRNNLFLVTNCWKNRSFFQLKNCGLALRFVNTHHLDSNDYIQALYNKLSSKDPYQFLDQNIENNEVLKVDEKLSSSAEFKEFLNIIAKSDASEGSTNELSEIQKIFSEKFQDWTRVSQLRVGFLMHLDKRINSSEYLTKVIKHMSSVNLFDAGPHDLTALLLLIYFKRNFSVEDLSEYLDLEALQTSLSLKIDQNKLNQEEICAVCLGLKRITDMKVNSPILRRSLYNQLGNFVAKTDQLDDFFVMTLMTTLSKGNMVFMDDVELVRNTLSKLEFQVPHLKLDTAIKIMTFPLTIGFSNRAIEENVFSRIKDNIDELETWDMIQLCNYISKQPTDFAVTDEIFQYLERKLSNLTNLDELMDIIECFHYLSHRSIYSEKFNDVLFAGINSLPGDCFNKDTDFSALTKNVASSILKNLNVADDIVEREMVYERNMIKTISVFTRIPAFISTCYRIETGVKENLIEPSRADILSKSQHRRLPMELHVPQMNTKNLDQRSKHLINCYRAMTRFMGNEQYVGVTRILPHFSEPDLVFGNIGGNSLTIPSYLTDPEFVGFRRPPPGDWWVIVVGTRKSHDLAGNVIGQEAAKLRQLEKLGYTPIVIPNSDLGAPSTVIKSLAKLLKTENISLPNLDDGLRERNRKF
eukprot:GFUD01037355.1.p1 GENE.GFUD01037355.1~~GFUD01037355.1.p1  ORF type:complete len:642 (+),score=139.80 GFUD01037355.1:77-2002(+)